jgi:hypothetical protein
VRVPEGHTDKLLIGHLIEPVSEGPVRTAETEGVVIHSFLVVLAVVRGCCPRLMHEVRQWVLPPTFACVDRGHGTAVFNFVSLILCRYDVEGGNLEVQQALPPTLNVARVRWLI